MIFDTHTHVHFPLYDKDRDDVIKRAQKVGVKMICVGTQAATSKLAIGLAKKYPNDIWATVGFHPNHLSENWYHDRKEQKEPVREKFDVKKLGELAKDSKVVAIGECGLDYYRLTDASREDHVKNQKEAFSEQIKLAESLGKALMMHTRPSAGSDDAYEDTLEILRENPISVPKINHFYVGSLTVTKKLLEAGFYFTFGGVITFSRDYDTILNYIPLDRIMLETDAPYVAPEPHRGKRNEPAYIIETAKHLAELRGESIEKIAEQTTKNALQVFKITI
ncbi:MAG: TatD family hydrolase [Candidatus Harrisonbacteria bacterium]|nr:TatD family hydrolase [Candidatus Harrisonbacteria bacterium]